MPVVRIQREVNPAALPGARRQAAENDISAGVALADQQARTDLSAATLGQTVATTGVAITREQRDIADKEKQRAEDIGVMKAGNQLAEWEQQTLYDPEHGALLLKGEKAFGLPEKVRADYQAYASQVEQSLGTDRQREAFARIKLQRQQGIDEQLHRHVFAEMQRHEGQELQAFVENARSAAITNAADPKRVGLELDRAVAAIRTHAPNLGIGPEELAHQIDAVTTATHVGVIENLLAQERPKAAAVYFDEMKGQIKGEALAHIEKALGAGSTQKEEQDAARTILAAGGTLAEQRDKADKLDPKIADNVKARLVQEDGLKKRAAAEKLESQLNDAYQIVNAGLGADKIPPAMQADLAQHMPTLRRLAAEMALGYKTETDWSTYYALATMAGNKPNDFAEENLLAHRAKLGDTEFKQLIEMQKSIRAGDLKAADKTLPGFQTKEQIVDGTALQFGIPHEPSKRSADQKLMIVNVRRQLDARVEELQAGGKKATNQDLQSETDRLFGAQFQTLKPGYLWNAKDKPLLSITIADIPDLQKAALRAALQKRGRPVTDATMLDLYIANRMKMGR